MASQVLAQTLPLSITVVVTLTALAKVLFIAMLLIGYDGEFVLTYLLIPRTLLHTKLLCPNLGA